MKILAVAAILIGSVASTTKEPIRPHLHAANNEDDTASFLNGVSAKCPEGFNAVDVKHEAGNNLTYQQVFNAVADVECQPK